MKNENLTEDHLAAMIRALPEREAPPAMQKKIMAEICSPEQSFRHKVKKFMLGPVSFSVRPLRLAAAACMLLMAFWLGLTLGHQDQQSLVALNQSRELLIDPANPEANFFIGKGLLAADRWEEARPYLERASSLVPENPEYSLWVGVALGKSGNIFQEQKIYNDTLRRHPDYIPARLYLGHALLEKGQTDAALTEYTKVLSREPDTEVALYNRALAYQLLGEQRSAIAAWKEYLSSRRTGSRAFQAVEHLNELGDFTFRTYQIGYRKIILNQKSLLEPDSPARQEEILYLADSFRSASGMILNIVAFQTDDSSQARESARDLKNSINEQFEPLSIKSIRISWFGQPERVRLPSGKLIPLRKSLLIFSRPGVQEQEEKRI